MHHRSYEETLLVFGCSIHNFVPFQLAWKRPGERFYHADSVNCQWVWVIFCVQDLDFFTSFYRTDDAVNFILLSWI